MQYLLFAISITATVVQSTLFNHVGKKELRTGRSVWIFNTALYLFSFILFLIGALGKPLSLFTLLFGLAFGLVTIIQSTCNLMALKRGPMHITLLITTSSLVIPSLSGAILNGERLSVGKLIAILVLLVFIYLSVDRSDKSTFKPGWLLFTLITFTMQAAVGIMQKTHQSSPYAAETAGFLAAAFFCSVIFAAAMTIVTKSAKSDAPAAKPGRALIPVAVVCGLCTYLQNDLNLKLSGLIPSQIFFPVVNGGVLFLNALAALLLFREKLTKRQVIGLTGGILTLFIICILP